MCLGSGLLTPARLEVAVRSTTWAGPHVDLRSGYRYEEMLDVPARLTDLVAERATRCAQLLGA